VERWKQRYRGEHALVIRSDGERDVALLQLEGLIDAGPLPLARTRPREGEQLWVIGTPCLRSFTTA